MRAGFCGGATVSPEVLLFFWILGVPIYQIYGMTESSGVAFMQRPGATRSGCSGLAVEASPTRIADDGELLLRGPSVFKGYLFDDEATKRAVIDGWLHTGDIVEAQDNGEVRIVDRKKDILITSGGKNITPSLIENALKDCPIFARRSCSATAAISWRRSSRSISRPPASGRSARASRTPPIARSPRTSACASSSSGERQARQRPLRARRERAQIRHPEKELDHDDGELTATMKVRRRMIEQKFRDEIVEIYGSAA